MSVTKLKAIIAISITVNILLLYCCYVIYEQNSEMKKSVIEQYASQQKEALQQLERALHHEADKEEYIKALSLASAIIYHNELVTRNYSYMGQYVKFPESINHLNSPISSKAVGYSLINSALDRPNDEWKDELELYTSLVSQVVNKINEENNIEKMSLRAQYKNLEEASQLIDELLKDDYKIK